MALGNLAFVVYALLDDFAAFTLWPPQVTFSLMAAVILFNGFYILMLRFRRSAGSPHVVTPVFP